MITTHVLDTAAGKPASDISVVLSVHREGSWIRVASGHTDAQGRLTKWPTEIAIERGVYRLTFDIATYHRDIQSFFPEVQVIFKVREDGEHVHVPLLISPFGYTTYRGT
jgi:5-hydroxyisourate hydrolase